jgi:hypothetical protein
VEAAMTRLALAILLSCGSATAVGAQTDRANPDALLLQDFTHRVDAYMKVHKRLEDKAPPLETTKDPAKIKASQEGLMKAIQAERAGARQGEIFTPEISALVRRLMYPEIKGKQGTETKQAIKDDAPPRSAVTLKVNAAYPSDAPLPSVPPNLLASLPKLPDDLEYRVIGRDLILRDVHANLIVDFLPNAIR